MDERMRAAELERLARVEHLLRNLLSEVCQMKARVTADERMGLRSVGQVQAVYQPAMHSGRVVGE